MGGGSTCDNMYWVSGDGSSSYLSKGKLSITMGSTGSWDTCDVRGVRSDVRGVRSDVRGFRSDVRGVSSDFRGDGRE